MKYSDLTPAQRRLIDALRAAARAAEKAQAERQAAA